MLPLHRKRVERLLATAAEAARAAALVHREAARRGGGRWVNEKTAASDFVSDVDMAAQEAALAVIAERHPDHAILAEEEGGGRAGAPGDGHLWLVDPLDGTTNFLHGHPYHAASVAVWDGEGPIAAAVEAQALGKVWTAGRGRGARENGERIRVSGTARLDRYLLGTGFPFKAHELLPEYLAQLDRALRRTAGVRRTGAAAIDLAYVANGILDGFWESRLGPWDFGAGVLLVTEAGGVVERVEGGGVGAVTGSVMAANSEEGLEGLRVILAE
ncbi:MAG: inositol monophosphatase family protein [Gemmatimonadota bacterium]|nr:inositol monophosphatase family protein [Gemmatimonadota bacterium]MDE2870362.1 inositol monophosphatase family protein [Gemmatimonadota bacterium]